MWDRFISSISRIRLGVPLLFSCFLIFIAPLAINAANVQLNDSTQNDLNQKRVRITIQREYESAIKEIELDLFDMNNQLDWIRFQTLRLSDTRQGIPEKLTNTKKRLENKIISKQKELHRLKNIYAALNPPKANSKPDVSSPNLKWPSQAETSDQSASPFTDTLDVDKPFAEKKLPEETSNADQPLTNQQAIALKSEIETKMSKMDLNEWLDVYSKNGRLVLYVKWPIVFESNKISLSDHYLSFLGTLAEFLSPYNQIKINLEGYSSSNKLGQETFSSKWELAVRRAIFVANQLIKKGVPAYVFNINSRGEKSNDYYNYTKLDSASKRRVEMTIYF